MKVVDGIEWFSLNEVHQKTGITEPVLKAAADSFELPTRKFGERKRYARQRDIDRFVAAREGKPTTIARPKKG